MALFESSRCLPIKVHSVYLWCSTECWRCSIGFYVLFAQAEVSKDYVSLWIQENVLWLQVSVHDVQRVQVPQGACNLGCIEPRTWLQKASLPLQVIEQLLKDKEKEETD